MSVCGLPKPGNRTRPPARKRRRSLFRKSSTMWATRALVVTVAVAIGIWLVGRVVRPFRLVSHEQREKARVVAQYQALRKENEGLRRRLQYLKTSEGMAREARKQGFVRPGEVSLVIPEDHKNTN